MSDYKQSRNFCMNISLEELIKYNKTCKINTNSKQHFETYEGILIYVSYPGAEKKFTVELGVDDDGIMYEGDYGCCQEHFKEIPIEEGLKILTKFRELLIAKFDLEYSLLRNKLNNDVIKIEIR